MLQKSSNRIPLRGNRKLYCKGKSFYLQFNIEGARRMCSQNMNPYYFLHATSNLKKRPIGIQPSESFKCGYKSFLFLLLFFFTGPGNCFWEFHVLDSRNLCLFLDPLQVCFLCCY